MELSEIPGRYADPDPSIVSKLPKGGDRTNKVTCTVCGGWHNKGAAHLDYVGHAEITLLLIQIDPDWNWEPMALDADGTPLIRRQGNLLEMWARLTVAGKTVICVGTCEHDKFEPAKELIGDMLRNGAMRFGVGTKLWSKAGGADPTAVEAGGGYDGSGGGRARTVRQDDTVPTAAPTKEQEAASLFAVLDGKAKAAVTKAAREVGVLNVMKSGDRADVLLELIAAHAGEPAQPEGEPGG